MAGTPRALVILLTGPSGSGKSRVATRSRLPVISLDDFYKDASDPTVPRVAGAVNWESPAAWQGADALHALVRLSYDRRAELPVYDISRDQRVGSRMVEIGDAPAYVAEGIFAAELVEGCRDYGILGDALCLRRSRDRHVRAATRPRPRERRKPASVLLRRGWALRQMEDDVVATRVALGARACGPREALHAIRAVEAPADDPA
jgi:uridine kinase